MASESERTASASDLLSVADLTMASEIESQSDLPEHDENRIRYGIKIYTRGKARPARGLRMDGIGNMGRKSRKTSKTWQKFAHPKDVGSVGIRKSSPIMPSHPTGSSLGT